MIDDNQKKVKRYINLKPESGSFIFCGPKNTGKEQLAGYFVEGLLKKKYHTKNVINIDLKKDKSKISIEQIKEALYYMKLKSQKRMFCIIKNASFMSENASNALLKSLEEPFKKKIFILISESKEDLLETIISRSTVIKTSLVSPLKLEKEFNNTLAAIYSFGKINIAYNLSINQKAVQEVKEKTDELIRLLEVSLWEKFNLIEEIEKREENVIEIIDLWISYLTAGLEAGNFDDFSQFRGYFKDNFDNQRLAELLKGLLKLREVLKSSNASKKLQMEAAFI